MFVTSKCFLVPIATALSTTLSTTLKHSQPLSTTLNPNNNYTIVTIKQKALNSNSSWLSIPNIYYLLYKLVTLYILRIEPVNEY